MKTYSNCIYCETGCEQPGNCARCGFDRREDARRRKLPLERLPNGLYGKKLRKRRRADM